MPDTLEITNPRRILLVGTPGSGKLILLKALTGSLPPGTATVASPAGLSHSVHLKTAYYTVDIPIWIDEIEDGKSTEWAAGYRGAEASEVRNALGGFVLTFRKPQDETGLEVIKQTLAALQGVVKACGSAWDGVCLAVAMPQSLRPHLEMAVEDWEDMARGFQFEYVDFEFKGRNDYGEPAGMERVTEALEANDWGGDDGDDASFGEFEDGEEGEEGVDPLKYIGDEMGREMFGLHNAIFGDGPDSVQGDDDDDDDDEELQVEKLEAMMMKMTALKDMGDDVSKEERRKLAAKAISDIIKSDL